MYAYNKHGVYLHNNKFIYNGVNLSNVVVVESVTRPILPTIINEGLFIDGKAGQLLKRSVIDNKLIQVHIRILESTKEERDVVLKKLKTALYSSTPKKLELKDTNLYNYAQITSTSDLNVDTGTRSVSLMFECYDPFDYGEVKQTPINSDFINEGGETVGVLKCTTNATNLIRVKQRNKVMLTIEHNVIAGNELVIDLEKELITLNGASIMKYLSLNSDFFTIDPGLNNITVEGVSSGTVEYRERWL